MEPKKIELASLFLMILNRTHSFSHDNGNRFKAGEQYDNYNNNNNTGTFLNISFFRVLMDQKKVLMYICRRKGEKEKQDKEKLDGKRIIIIFVTVVTAVVVLDNTISAAKQL